MIEQRIQSKKQRIIDHHEKKNKNKPFIKDNRYEFSNTRGRRAEISKKNG